MVRRCSQGKAERDSTECARALEVERETGSKGRGGVQKVRQRKGLSPEPGERTRLTTSIMPRSRRYVYVPRATQTEQEDSATCIGISDALVLSLGLSRSPVISQSPVSFLLSLPDLKDQGGPMVCSWVGLSSLSLGDLSVLVLSVTHVNGSCWGSVTHVNGFCWGLLTPCPKRNPLFPIPPHPKFCLVQPSTLLSEDPYRCF